MLAVTASLSQAFEAQLGQRNVPDQQRRDFHKWLRFYLDFCAKFTLEPKFAASFAGFDEKLKSKGQSDVQRQQARRSIAIYYRTIGVIKSPQSIHPLKILRHWWCQTRLIRRIPNRPIYHTQFRCLPLRLNRRN